MFLSFIKFRGLVDGQYVDHPASSITRFFSDQFGIDNVRHCNSCLFHLHQDNISAEKRLRSEFIIIFGNTP